MTDKYYELLITPDYEDSLVIRVPEGVEITEEILEKSSFFENWYEEVPVLCGRDVCIEFEELVDQFPNDDDIPTLDKDGDITYDYPETHFYSSDSN